MNSYEEMKKRHRQEVNELPIKFAFGQKQFDEMMVEFGLKSDETDKIYQLGGTGGFYLRTDSAKIYECFKKHEEEMKEAIESDKTGEGFIFDMFRTELANHEYSYTMDERDAIIACGFSEEEVENNIALSQGLALAKCCVLNEEE